MKYLASALSLIFLPKTLIRNKMTFPASNSLNFTELVVKLWGWGESNENLWKDLKVDISAANIIPLPVTINRKIKKTPVKLSVAVAQFHFKYSPSSQRTHNNTLLHLLTRNPRTTSVRFLCSNRWWWTYETKFCLKLWFESLIFL